jgi:hypothetical protein
MRKRPVNKGRQNIAIDAGWRGIPVTKSGCAPERGTA